MPAKRKKPVRVKKAVKPEHGPSGAVTRRAVMEHYRQLGDLLLALEMAMREQSMWQSDRPSAEALASPHPFCVDTLTFPQWLQFVFIPRLTVVIEKQQPLPDNSEILPIAQEWFDRANTPGLQILELIGQFDALISGLHPIRR